MADKKARRWPVGLGITVAGGAVVVGAWLFGIRTGWFLVHIAFPLGFWLIFEGLVIALGLPALALRPGRLAAMLLFGAALGLLLDFFMVHLTRILVLPAVADLGIVVQMYIGWGFCMPAVYQSYRVALLLVGCLRVRPASQQTAVLRLPRAGRRFLIYVGAALFEAPLFARLWADDVPGWMIVPAFLGLWMIGESLLQCRERPGLLGALLGRDLKPLLAMALASLPFTWLWEALNYGFMHSWRYQNIFLLEPRLVGVPVVAYGGYLCGYYALFLTLYAAVQGQTEEALPVFAAEPPPSDSTTLPSGRIPRGGA